MKSKSKTLDFFLPSQIHIGGIKKPIVGGKSRALSKGRLSRVLHEPLFKTKSKSCLRCIQKNSEQKERSKQKKSKFVIKSNLQITHYKSQNKLSEIHSKFAKKQDANVKKIKRSDINGQKIDYVHLYMTKKDKNTLKSAYSQKEPQQNKQLGENSPQSKDIHIPEQNSQSFEEQKSSDILESFPSQIQLTQKQNQRKKKLQVQERNEKSFAQFMEFDIVTIEKEKNSFFQQNYALPFEVLSLRQRRTSDIYSLKKEKMKNMFLRIFENAYPSGAKRIAFIKYKKVLFHSVPFKNMSFKLNMHAQIINKNGFQEFVFLSIDLRKSFKQSKDNYEAMKDEIIYGILNIKNDLFTDALSLYIQKQFVLKKQLGGYRFLKGEDIYSSYVYQAGRQFFVQVKNKYLFVHLRLLSLKKAVIQNLFNFQSGKINQSLKGRSVQIIYNFKNKNFKITSSLIAQVEKIIERQIYNNTNQRVEKMQQKNICLYNDCFYGISVKMKATEKSDDKEYVFQRITFKVIEGQKKSKVKTKRGGLRQTLLQSRQSDSPHIQEEEYNFFRYHNGFDFGIRKEKKMVKIDDSFFYVQNLKNFSFIGIFGDGKFDSFRIDDQYEKEKIIILNLPLDLNQIQYKRKAKAFLKLVKQKKDKMKFKGSNERKFRFVLNKNIFTCELDPSLASLSIRISSVNNRRIQFLSVSHSLFSKIIYKKKQKNTKEQKIIQKVTSYCSQLIKRKKYLGSFHCHKNQPEVLKITFRKVEKLCHGVFIIFTGIQYVGFGSEVIKIYVSEVEKTLFVNYKMSSKRMINQIIKSIFETIKGVYFEQFIKKKNETNKKLGKKKYPELDLIKILQQASPSQKKQTIRQINNKQKIKKLKLRTNSKNQFLQSYQIYEEVYFQTYVSLKKNKYIFTFFLKKEFDQDQNNEIFKCAIQRNNQILIYLFDIKLRWLFINPLFFQKWLKNKPVTQRQISKAIADQLKKTIAKSSEKRRNLIDNFRQILGKNEAQDQNEEDFYFIKLSKTHLIRIKRLHKTKTKLLTITDLQKRQQKKIQLKGEGFASCVTMKYFNHRLIKRMLKTLDFQKIFND